MGFMKLMRFRAKSPWSHGGPRYAAAVGTSFTLVTGWQNLVGVDAMVNRL